MVRRRNKFDFLEGACTRFSCNLRCGRCQAWRRRGGQCQNRICRYTPFCYAHCLSELGVRVRPSGLHAGEGLYANRRVGFRPGEPIAPLLGQRITPAESVVRYGRFPDGVAPYVTDSTGRLNDGACRRGIGFYSVGALRPPPSEHDHFRRPDPAGCNARIGVFYLTPRKRPARVPYEWLVATKPIRPGEEIITDFGARYSVDTSDDNPYTYTTY